MGEMIATIGALRFALRRHEHAEAIPNLDGQPFAVMPDGTEVQLVVRGGESYLVVDHRRDNECATRIEFWECLDRGEGSIVGLYALTNASTLNVRPRKVAS